MSALAYMVLTNMAADQQTHNHPRMRCDMDWRLTPTPREIAHEATPALEELDGPRRPTPQIITPVCAIRAAPQAAQKSWQERRRS